MLDIWVAGFYDKDDKKSARGAWYCPDIGAWGNTLQTKADNEEDAIRIGCAMAILSVFHCLGGKLSIHICSTPSPAWVTDTTIPTPNPNRFYRLIYRTLIYPRIKSGNIKFVITQKQGYVEELKKCLSLK